MGNRKPRETPEHAVGQQGPKSHERLIEQLESGPSGEPTQERLDHDQRLNGLNGGRHLVEDRQQHDEAEKNSERNRLFKDHRRGEAQDGPVDTSHNINGMDGHRDHRSDYKMRDQDGLLRKNERDRDA